MKRIFLCFLICLLLVGCAAPAQDAMDDTQPEQTDAPETEAVETTEPVDRPGQGAEELFGVWRNAGQYEEGREFVETMTLDEEGNCYIQFDYQGEPYQLLRGTYYVVGRWLYTTMETGEEETCRNFIFTRDGRELILESETKTVTYIKID